MLHKNTTRCFKSWRFFRQHYKKNPLLNPKETVAVCVRACVSVCSCQPYRSSLGGRLSLLSAPHVSQANVLIHSAYLPSICLHYNHSRIIGFLLCSQIGTFISESFLVLRSLHLKLPCRQARTLHDTHTHVQPQVLSMHLKNKGCHCRAERENSSRGGREGEEAGASRQCPPRIRSSYIVVWNFRWHQKMFGGWGGWRAGSMTVEVEGRTRGRTEHWDIGGKAASSCRGCSHRCCIFIPNLCRDGHMHEIETDTHARAHTRAQSCTTATPQLLLKVWLPGFLKTKLWKVELPINFLPDLSVMMLPHLNHRDSRPLWCDKSVASLLKAR